MDRRRQQLAAPTVAPITESHNFACAVHLRTVWVLLALSTSFADAAAPRAAAAAAAVSPAAVSVVQNKDEQGTRDVGVTRATFPGLMTVVHV
jgi:hypothetical protein